MENIIPLSCLPLGKYGVINSICVSPQIKRRLLDIGFIEGTRLLCVLKNPSGDPSAYLVRGAVIALRDEDSSQIFISV